jgi:membrane glycosyltransferase
MVADGEQLWMMPVVLGLLIAIPLAVLSSSTSTMIFGLFKTPEETSPPRVLLRANELFGASRETISCPLLELRNNADLREAHLNHLVGPRKRKRGEVNIHLATARAKIAEAETFNEAVSFLNSREKFAVLNSRITIGALMALPSSNQDGSAYR